LLGRPLYRAKFNILHLHRIEQKGAPPSLATYGYIYATPVCLNNPSGCDLHVALHGCQMDDDFDGDFQNLYQTKVQMTHILGVPNYELSSRHRKMGALSFARRSGYAEYAEDVTNHVMILFPQTQITSDNYPGNPNGCWDWFGWTGSDYATNKGVETSWLNSYVQSVRQDPKNFFMTKVTETSTP
jgi:poly(3-hydroxybutyrate) depolymerase